MRVCIASVSILGLVLWSLPGGAEPEPGGEVVAPTAEASPAPAEAAAGRVARAAVTTDVVAREPVDSVDRVSDEVGQLSYFTELIDLQGHTITHVWERQGEEMARVSFEVGGPRWRVHSTKRLRPDWIGAWKVSVVDEAGNELRSDHFYFAEAEVAEPAAADAAPGEETPPAATP